MKTLQFTDHSLFLKGKTQTHKFLKIWLTLIGSAFFLLSNQSFAETKIAFIDTGFCPKLLKNKSVKVSMPFDLTHSNEIECSAKKVNLLDSRYHGQMVLIEFMKFFKPKNSSDYAIFPLVVFDKNGNQKKEYWQNGIKWIEENKIDLVVTAAGFQTNEKIVTKLPSVWFVSSGRVGGGITNTTSLFPQLLAPMDNLFIIGDYYDGRIVLYDQGLIYQDKIDYSFPSGLKGFKGTSRSVAEAAARAILLCSSQKMRECLKGKSKVYRDTLSKRDVTTFE
jgi:hypothetical protein